MGRADRHRWDLSFTQRIQTLLRVFWCAGFNSADGMNYPQLDSEDSSNVDCFGELPSSCICLYIYIYHCIYCISSRIWIQTLICYACSIVQCCICFTHFNIRTSAHDALFASEWSIHRSLPPNHAELYMDKLGERIKTRAVFHHVKLCCGPSTRWLPLFFMEQPRYWKNILTGEDWPHM